MKNIFKTNSRFSVLAEEKTDTKHHDKETKKNKEHEREKEKSGVNSFKSENNSFKRDYESRPYRNFDDRNQRNFYTNKLTKEQQERIAREEQLRKEQEEKLKAEKFASDMAPENFPDLVTIKKEIKTQPNYISFLDKVKSEIIETNNNEDEEEDLDFKNLKPGWAISKMDPVTKKIVTKYKETNEPNPREKTENEIGYDILCALTNLHERRTQEYIDMWGYDTWQKMFRFPDYDYEYFDRLDEEYEEEMARLEEEENKEYDSEFTNDKDRYENYWKNY
jgi:hypothetical protein